MYYLLASIVIGVGFLLLYYKIYKDRENKGNLFNNILGAIFFALLLVLFLKSCGSSAIKQEESIIEQTSD